MSYYERSYGPKHGDLKRLTGKDYPGAADIAKLIRADIKKATTTGDLPTTFAGHAITYAVTVDNYSGGRSIAITVRGVPEADRTEKRDIFGNGYETNVDTGEAKVLLAKLAAFHWAYNHDGSDIMTDYYDKNYGGHPAFEHEFTAKERERVAARAKELKANPKPKKASKRDLLNHLRYHHKRRYNEKDNLSAMLRGHGFLHTHATPYEFDKDHDHDGDLLLPKETATA